MPPIFCGPTRRALNANNKRKRRDRWLALVCAPVHHDLQWSRSVTANNNMGPNHSSLNVECWSLFRTVFVTHPSAHGTARIAQSNTYPAFARCVKKPSSWRPKQTGLRAEISGLPRNNSCPGMPFHSPVWPYALRPK